MKNKKNDAAKKSLSEKVFSGSALSKENLPKEKKSKEKTTLLSYLQKNFPLVINLLESSINKSQNFNDKIFKQLNIGSKINETIKNEHIKTQKTVQKIHDNLTKVKDTLIEANKQRLSAADLEEERFAESEKEKIFLEKQKAEQEEKQNAEIISKLTALDESLNNLDVGGSQKGPGLIDSMLGLIGKMIPSILPMVTGALAGLASTLAGFFTAALPVILPLITAALAGAAGWAIFKMVIEPWMDKKNKAIEEELAPVLSGPSQKKTDVVTDTGEKVFSKEDTKTGEVSYVTESQMQSELSGMSEEDRKKIQSGEGPVAFERASNIVDVHSGMFKGDPLESGKSIEEINRIAKETKEGISKLSPSQKAQREFAKEIVNFDESFRNQLAKTMTAWAKEGGAGASLSGGRETFKTVLGSLFNEHKSIINRIRSDKNLKSSDREALLKLSPLFEDSFGVNDPKDGSDPDYDTVWLLGYDLPSGQGLTFDWANSAKTFDENRAIIDKEFGNPSGRAESLRKKYDAKNAKEQTKEDASPESIPASDAPSSLEVSKEDASPESIPAPDAPSSLEVSNIKFGDEMTGGSKTTAQSRNEEDIQLLLAMNRSLEASKLRAQEIMNDPTTSETRKDKQKVKIDLSDKGIKLNNEKIKKLQGSVIPKAEEGAVIFPKTSDGVLANISENMKPEAVVPLDEYTISKKESKNVKNTEAYSVGDDITNIIRSSYFEEKDSKVEQQPVIVNNINNNKQTSGSVGDPTNFGFQSNMAKTFDNIFDLILEKNMKMGIN